MKKFIFLVFLFASICHADSKLTVLSTDTTPSLTDVLYEAKNPAGASSSKQVQIQTLLSLPGSSTSYILSTSTPTLMTYSSATANLLYISSTSTLMTYSSATVSLLNISSAIISGATTTWTGTNFFDSSTSILGTTTNNEPCAGCVGELISTGTLSVTSNLVPGNSTTGQLLTFNLTAGDWDVKADMVIRRLTGSYTTTDFDLCIGSIPASTTGCILGLNYNAMETVFPNAFSSFYMDIPEYRIKISSGTQNWYLNLYIDNYTSGSSSWQGQMVARRAR